MLHRSISAAAVLLVSLSLLTPAQAHPTCPETHQALAPVQAGTGPSNDWYDSPNPGTATIVGVDGDVTLAVFVGQGCLLASFCFTLNSACFLPISGGQFDHLRVTGPGDYILTFA